MFDDDQVKYLKYDLSTSVVDAKYLVKSNSVFTFAVKPLSAVPSVSPFSLNDNSPVVPGSSTT